MVAKDQAPVDFSGTMKCTNSCYAFQLLWLAQFFYIDQFAVIQLQRTIILHCLRVYNVTCVCGLVIMKFNKFCLRGMGDGAITLQYMVNDIRKLDALLLSAHIQCLDELKHAKERWASVPTDVSHKPVTGRIIQQIACVHPTWSKVIRLSVRALTLTKMRSTSVDDRPFPTSFTSLQSLLNLAPSISSTVCTLHACTSSIRAILASKSLVPVFGFRLCVSDEGSFRTALHYWNKLP